MSRWDGALEAAARKIRDGSRGDRSNRTYSAARWLGERVHDGGSEAEALTVLQAAAEMAGMRPGEARHHVQRGLAHGMASPDMSDRPAGPPPPRRRPPSVAERIAQAQRAAAVHVHPPREYETAEQLRTRKHISPDVWADARVRDAGTELVFPVVDVHGRVLTRKRILTVPKSIPCWDGTPGAVEAVYGSAWWRPHWPVVWANGESSVWTALSHHISAACGCIGEKPPTPAVSYRMKHLLAGRPLLVCYDLDEVGQKSARLAVEAFRAAGVDASGVTLPDYLGRGGDLGDFCVRHGEISQTLLLKLERWS